MTRTTIAAAFGLAGVLAATTTQAGTVTFDPADGYALGSSLAGGPGWSGTGTLWSIESLGGGNGAAKSNDVNAPFNENRFTPDAAFLGGTTAALGQYDYSFQIRGDSAAASEDFSTAFILRIGQDVSGVTGDVIRMNIFDNGRIQLSTSGGSANITTGSGTNFDLDNAVGRFVDVSGVIDFDTSTYTLTFDGVAQTLGGSTDIPFQTAGQDEFGRFLLAFGNSGDSPRRGITLDNLSASLVIPEPATALLVVFGLAAVGLRHQRS